MSPTWLSGGTLTGIALIVMLPRERVLEELSRYPALELGELAGAPKGQHPVCLDLFHVEDGQVELGARGQDAFWRSLAQASGAVLAGTLGAFGAELGALAGAMSGAALGLTKGPFESLRGGALGLGRGALSGARRGLGMGREGGQRLEPSAAAVSELLTRSLGNYREVLFGIPGVTSAGRGPFLLVLEMLSDGGVAIAADRAFGYGFHKRPARFAWDASACTAATSAGQPLLEVSSLAPPRARSKAGSHCFALDWHCQPLLGRTAGGKFALSLLERDFGARDCVIPLGAVSHGSSALETRLFDGSQRAPAFDATHPWGGVAYTRVRARISLPRPFG